MLLKTEEFQKTELCVLVWKKHFETELFENNDVTIITWFVWPGLPQTQIQHGGQNGDCDVDFARWVQLKPCYVHAHGCTQAFLLLVTIAFSNFSGVVWTKNIWWIFRVKPPFSYSSRLMWMGPQSSRRKTLRARRELASNLTHIWHRPESTWSTLVGGMCSHRCTILAPQILSPACQWLGQCVSCVHRQVKIHYMCHKDGSFL